MDVRAIPRYQGSTRLKFKVPDHVPIPTANMNPRSISSGPTACGDSRDLLSAWSRLPGGVKVAQRTLAPLIQVRILAGQPDLYTEGWSSTRVLDIRGTRKVSS